MKRKTAYDRFAISLSSLMLTAATGCTSIQFPNTDTCMQAKNVNALLVGFGGTSYNTNCNDGRIAFALMARAGDPVGNALGFLLYLDQNPEAKKMLEGRMGGESNVRLSEKTIAGLLLSDDEVSRGIGAQIYVSSDEKSRSAVNDILKAGGVDPRQHITANLGQNTHDAAKAWARDHANAPDGVTAETTRARQGHHLKTETGNGVTFTFRKPVTAP